MGTILNLANIPPEFVGKYAAGAQTLFMGNAAGSEKLYVNLDLVPPGCKSAKYHSHSKQEEFFLVLSGSGTLRLNGEEYPVQKDDFIAKPAGKNIAHQFINTGTEMLQILDVGTNENEEIVHYPDEDVYYVRGHKKAFKGESKLTDWDSEPNS